MPRIGDRAASRVKRKLDFLRRCDRISPMLRRPALILVLTLLAAPLAAQETCGPIPDRTALEDKLFEDLSRTRNAAEAAPINAMLWEVWLEAPDRAAAQAVTDGMAARRVADFAAAEAIFSDLIARCPDWAEGWNQRAFVRFLSADYGGAITDLEAALERNPRHVGALSGLALSLIGAGRNEAGQGALREALALNPWLAERALLDEPQGQDL
jgi:tetratricopeptide (TPR) repeat protein